MFLLFWVFFFVPMYDHVVVEHLLHCSTASTAQQSAVSPHKAAKQVRADQSATTQASRQRASTVLQYRNHSTAQRHQSAQRRKTSTRRSECNHASKQTESARASTCRRAIIQHAEFSKRRNRSLPDLQKYTTTQRGCDARRT